MSDHAPFRIKRNLLEPHASWIHSLAEQFEIEPEPIPHITLIYSKTPVDLNHSALKPETDDLSIIPDEVSLARFGDHIVLLIRSDAISERHQALKDAGARSDFPAFNPHITIGRDTEQTLTTLPEVSLPDAPFVFGPENFKVLPRGVMDDPCP